MIQKSLDTTAEQSTLPYTYTLLSSGILVLPDNKTGRLYHITVNDEWKDYYVLYIGETDEKQLPKIDKLPKGQEVLVRIDSGCLTGMVFGDITCDCHEQLKIAIKSITDNKLGFIIHIPSQDGRGMGIDFKLKTLDQQYYNGFNTVESAKVIAHTKNIDRRTYQGAVGCLKFLGLSENLQLNIDTNNPQKIKAFHALGYKNTTSTRVLAENISEDVKKHLKAKHDFLGHMV